MWSQSSPDEQGDPKLRALYALIGVTGSAFIPFFALLLRDRGLNPELIGLVLAVVSLAGVAATPVWSHVADARLGTLPTLRTSCLASCIAGLGMIATGSSFLAIGSAALVLGAAQGPQTGLTDALALGTLGRPRLHEYGSFRLWASIGWGIGSIAFGAVFQGLGLGALLPVYVVALAAYVIFLGRFPTVRPEPGSVARSRLGSVGDAFRSVPRLAAFLTGVLVLATSTHAAWDFVPLRIVSKGGGAFLVGIASGVSAFVEIPFMRSSGSLVRRYGLPRVFAAGAAVYAAASVGWALFPNPLAVTILRISVGIGFGLVYVSLVVMTGRLVPDRLRNTGQALLSICLFGLAPVIGGAAGGLVYQRVGPPELFAASAVGIAAGTVLVFLAASDAEDVGVRGQAA
jgi:PPP family 3-phenylpropionic acid transporter